MHPSHGFSLRETCAYCFNDHTKQAEVDPASAKCGRCRTSDIVKNFEARHNAEDQIFWNMPQKSSHHNFPFSSLLYLALQYLSSRHPDTLKTWCPGPGAWFDAMDVDRTGDLDLDEAWPTLSHQLGFSPAQLAGAWSFGPGLSVFFTRNGG